MVIQIGKQDEDSFVHKGGWDAFIASENRIIVKAKPYYKIDAFRGLLLAGVIFVTVIEFVFPFKLLGLYFLIPMALFILAAIYITVFKPLKSFKGFEIEVRNGVLIANNENVLEVCMFAVCDPDDPDYARDKDGIFGFDSKWTIGGNNPVVYIGFQFITNNECFYARGSLGPLNVMGMQVIFDFLIKHKIIFTYKYKEIRPQVLCIATQFKRFENEFDLDDIKQIETDVQSAKRYIRKEDKYPSDGVLNDQVNN
jgi:hypothetical protein